MKIKSVIKKILVGNTFAQEYLCISSEACPVKLQVFIEGENEQEVTSNHLFLGYKPLLMAFPGINTTQETSENENIISLIFRDPRNGKSVASLVLKKVGKLGLENNPLDIYEGINGQHDFLSFYQRLLRKFDNRLKKRDPSNVFLPDPLYDQVVAAYSIPRRISILSLGKNNLFNMFPTDLNGMADNDQYIISLRHNGKACKQVEETGKVALSSVPLSWCGKAYSLGRNHMQDFKPADAFPVANMKSQRWEFPLPEGVTFWREMELISSLSVGIHKLMSFRIVATGRIPAEIAPQPELFHIHRDFGIWMKRERMMFDYFRH